MPQSKASSLVPASEYMWAYVTYKRWLLSVLPSAQEGEQQGRASGLHRRSAAHHANGGGDSGCWAATLMDRCSNARRNEIVCKLVGGWSKGQTR